MKKIPNGVYPVMITPYTEKNTIDWAAVDGIVEFYARHGCQGIFAVCQSSELFFLTEDERAQLAERVVKASAGRMCVVASGHVSDDVDNQIRELRRIADAGVEAVVMISNRLAKQDEDDSVLIANMNRILDALPDVTFGMYECPYPYKRLLSDEVLTAMAESGRFAFIKDTCCDAELIARRTQLLAGRVQLFNANTATLLETMITGADGFSGVMANFHPDLYVWLLDNFKRHPEAAKKLSAQLSLLSTVEACCYPVCAKYHMDRVGVPMTLISRVRDRAEFNYLNRHEIEDLLIVEETIREFIAKI